MLLALAAVLPPVGVATASTRPNIVFVLVDDADAALLEEMPNISSLIVDQGIRFERFYATQAQCCPSRSTLFTGEFVHNHNVRSNNKSEGGYARFLKEGHEERTVARELQQHSYRTGLFGKYLNHYGPRTGSARHVPPFWDRWFAPFNQSKYDYKVNDRGHVRTFGDRRRDYSTNAIGHISQKWITQNVGRPEPLFAYISYLAPHSPYVDPPGHRNDYKGASSPAITKDSFGEADVTDKPEHIRSMPTPDERDIRMINRRYRHRVRLMLGVDDMIGELISTLHELGALSDTYIIVSSDNGWMQGEHRLAKRKLAPYEESSRLPLFVRGPGIAPGISTDEPVSMVDIFATLSDLAGGTEQRDGRSLVPLFDGGETDWRDWLLLENLSGKHDVPNYFGVVGKTHKYIEYQTGETELYDLTADPRETSSIHESADPALLAQLSARVAAVRACAGPTCRSADTDP